MEHSFLVPDTQLSIFLLPIFLYPSTPDLILKRQKAYIHVCGYPNLHVQALYTLCKRWTLGHSLSLGVYTLVPRCGIRSGSQGRVWHRPWSKTQDSLDRKFQVSESGELLKTEGCGLLMHILPEPMDSSLYAIGKGSFSKEWS